MRRVETSSSAAAMVISAEPQRQPSDPVVAGGGGAGAAAAEEGGAARARLAPLSSSLKTWGSHRVLRCAPVNRAGDALSPAASRRSSPEELGEVREKLLLSLRAVQKQLDSLLPGAWLSEITVDSYRVPDER